MSIIGKLFGLEKNKGRVKLAESRGFSQQIVGEASYQSALRAICGGKYEFGAADIHTTLLCCEKNNPHDKNAVCVKIAGRIVGYLNRRDAVNYRAELAELDARLPDGIVSAKIVGGWKDEDSEGHFAVRLKLKRPLEVKES